MIYAECGNWYTDSCFAGEEKVNKCAFINKVEIL
jgi:hypothetical protein